ncbi:Ferredoxin [hydrothermal vent metagenome]|uniref:Ferredoxin n=1 Tax=hydrothermal vent metagenome TaxID=652676 RepID=A0A3B0Z2P8_9ZZZZ
MIHRRTALQRLLYTAGIAVASTLPYGFARLVAPEARADDPGTHLRPPGALKDDDAFNSACIGCGLCGEICPPRCIQFYQREGGDKVNTPYIDPEQKACILCNKCMEVCPTEALVEIPRDEVDMGIAQIDRSACYPWVDRGICGACVSICPLGERAIGFKYWNQYKPIVKTDCVGCGLCVEVCPHPSLPIRIVERSKGTIAHHRL